MKAFSWSIRGCGIMWLVAVSSVMAANYDLAFTINRPARPKLFWKDLTLKVDACGATNATVLADSKVIPCTIANGNVVFTTSGSSVVVSLTNPTSTTGFGTFTKAALKDDKKWAWSHSVDDNYDNSMDDEVAAFKAKGYIGLLYLNAYAFSFLTAPVKHYVNDGWTIGNHSYHHEIAQTPPNRLFPDDSEVTENDKAIYQQLANLGVTNFVITAFANPNFDGKWNTVLPPLYAAGKTDIVLLETGGNSKYVVDHGAATFSGYSALGYSIPIVIGRENGFGNVRTNADFMHANANDTRHFWYNSFSHGGEDNGTNSAAAVGYVHDTYGAEAWVDPVDRIYSYMLTRENATVTYTGSNADTTGLAVTGVSSLPDSICNETANSVTFTAHASITKGTIASVTIDLTSVGGGKSVAMTHSSGDAYTCSYTVAEAYPPGVKTLVASATASTGTIRTGSGTIKIGVGALRTLNIYTDNATLGAVVGWNGDGGANTSKATEITSGAYEGTKCVDFAYTVGAYWAGFGFGFNGTTLNATGYDTLKVAHKGPDPSLNCSVTLKSATGAPTIGTFQGSTGWVVSVFPIPSGTPLSAITEVNFNVANAQTSPAGHMFIDAILMTGHGALTRIEQVSAPTSSRLLSAASLGNRTIAVQAKAAGSVRIFDLLGNSIASIPVRAEHSGQFQYRAERAGTYVVRFESGNAKESMRVFVR